MQALALVVLIAAGLWLVGVAFLMALRPQTSLRLLETMSANLRRSNWRVHFIEQALRIMAGVALIVRAPASKLPLGFEVAGGFLAATSIIIMIAPIRWHGAYGTWWAKRINPSMVPLLSPVPALLGAGVIYAALGH